MKQPESISCDWCSNDLSTPNGCCQKHIMITTFSRRMDFSCPVLDVALPSPLEEDLYFCEMNCLEGYFNAE